MTREDVIAVLKAHEEPLKKRKVLHAALFGSLARGEAGPESDIDIMVELDEAALPSLWDYAGVCNYISDLFSKKVDVAQRAALRAHVKPSAERDAIYAFLSPFRTFKHQGKYRPRHSMDKCPVGRRFRGR